MIYFEYIIALILCKNKLEEVVIMQIACKRTFFTIILGTAIVISITMNNRTGFYASGSIICVPLIMGFIRRLLFPQIIKNDEQSMYISILLFDEKVYAAIDFLLIIVWVIVQIRCL